MDAFRARPNPEVAPKSAKKQAHTENQLLEREWSDLPYAMMRLTAARRAWDANRVYWRDRNVQLGEIDLHLNKTRAKGDVGGYTATYSHEDFQRNFFLHPSVNGGRLYWSASEISEVQLTTDQLAEKLLSRLVTFYTGGLS
jgi:hypothetical protein